MVLQTTTSGGGKFRGSDVAGIQEQTITCHHCFEQVDVGIEIGEVFTGHNPEVYDCVVCCNPLKLSYDVYDGQISSLTFSDGNE